MNGRRLPQTSEEMRPLLLTLLANEEPLEDGVRAELAYDYRRLCMSEAIVEDRFGDAYNFIEVAALGHDAFRYGRLCRASIDEPDVLIGLICSPYGVMKLVADLYEVMSAGELPLPEERRPIAAPWGPGFVPGSRVADLIRERTSANSSLRRLGQIASAMVLSIADHVVDRRTLIAA